MDLKLMPEKYKKKEGSESESGFSRFGAYLASKTNFWLVLSLVLLIGSVLIYFWLLGYKNDLIDKQNILTNNIEELQNQRDLELEANFMELKEKIDALKSVLKKRFYSSRILEMLEELTLANIRFIDLQADLSQMQLMLKVEAADYNTLAKQLIVFEEDLRIKKIDVSGIILDESGQISSEFLLEIVPEFLRR